MTTNVVARLDPQLGADTDSQYVDQYLQRTATVTGAEHRLFFLTICMHRLAGELAAWNVPVKMTSGTGGFASQ